MKKITLFRWLNVLGFLGTLLINTLANALPINGKNTGELSDAYPNLFVPAGLTFAIWGVIYLLLGMFAIYQSKNGEEYVRKIGLWFGISSLANILWIFMWHYEFVELSLLAMVILFISLLVIYLKLGIGKDKEISKKDKAFFHVPFSVYLGWITVATIANVTAVAVDRGWSGWGISEVMWTILVIIVAYIITLLIQMTRKDIGYSLVISWATLGIFLKRTDPEFTPQPLIAYTALVVSIVTLIGAIIVAIKKR
ncbi:MAG: hypothetical protein GF364_07905 [Candidatus Lokiarchaeota archaeon]|nr:hypothetical protein [Candidatus Lokiarchaeota archaeon]